MKIIIFILQIESSVTQLTSCRPRIQIQPVAFLGLALEGLYPGHCLILGKPGQPVTLSATLTTTLDLLLYTTS